MKAPAISPAKISPNKATKIIANIGRVQSKRVAMQQNIIAVPIVENVCRTLHDIVEEIPYFSFNLSVAIESDILEMSCIKGGILKRIKFERIL